MRECRDRRWCNCCATTLQPHCNHTTLPGWVPTVQPNGTQTQSSRTPGKTGEAKVRSTPGAASAASADSALRGTVEVILGCRWDVAGVSGIFIERCARQWR